MNKNTYSSLKADHHVLPYIQRWGRAPSIALLDASMKFFNCSDVDGTIGYKDTSGCVLVFGDPLCHTNDKAILVKKFHEHFTAQKKSIIYLLASEDFKQWAFEHGYIKTALSMGDEVIVDPHNDPLNVPGRHAYTLRKNYRIAQNNNLTFHEYLGTNEVIENAIEKIGQEWIEARKGPQTSLMHVNVFLHRSNKRFFYVKNSEDNFVGAIILNRLDGFNGWTINALFYGPNAPKYTSEYILLQTIAMLRTEGCRYFSFGTLPVAELRTIEGLGMVATFLAPYFFNFTKKIFKLHTRKQYWQKFTPVMVPSYLLVHKAGIGVKELLGILRAFNASL